MKFGKKALGLTLALALLAGCAAPTGGGTSPQAGGSLPDSVSQPESQPPQVTADTSLPLPAEGMGALTGRAVRTGDQRPVAVMLYNTKAGRPQWGIAAADIVIEANTEGQDSHLMALYEGYELVEKVGPVGPARDVFLQMAMPFGAIPMFVGCDIYTTNLLNQYTYQPLDGKYIGVNAYDYDSSRRGVYSSQYGWYAHKDLIPSALEQYGQSATGVTPAFFSFAESDVPANHSGGSLEIRYGENRCAVLEYEGSDQRYYLKEDGEFQIDGAVVSTEEGVEPDNKVRFTNVLLLMARSGWKDDGVTREYDLTGGQGLYLSGGGARVIRWQKNGPTGALKLFDEAGSALSVQPGRSYIGIWGGFAGQSLRLVGQDGAEQALPAAPEALPAPEPTAEPEGEPAAEPQSQPVSAAPEGGDAPQE